MIFFLALIISVGKSEWELPFEMSVHFLKQIGGFSPLINSNYNPKNNEVSNNILNPLTGNRSINLGSSSRSCLWDCFDSTSFPSPLSIQTDPVNASSECPPYSPNEPILPPIKLPSINPDGSCSIFDQHVLFHTNTSISCFVPFGNLLHPSKCDLIDTVLLSFWSQLDLPDALCNCDECRAPMIELNKTRNETDSECFLTSGIEIAITHQRGRINSYVIREKETLLADSSLTRLTLRIYIRFYDYHHPSDSARFWSRRHHVWCPSDISCLSEIWYPLSLLPPLSSQSIIASFIGAAIILIVMGRMNRRTLNPPDEIMINKSSD
ncbi:hypothetical protein PENTCL1PPCAC_11642, partial [Pristionchus entomophagus]